MSRLKESASLCSMVLGAKFGAIVDYIRFQRLTWHEISSPSSLGISRALQLPPSFRHGHKRGQINKQPFFICNDNINPPIHASFRYDKFITWKNWKIPSQLNTLHLPFELQETIYSHILSPAQHDIRHPKETTSPNEATLPSEATYSRLNILLVSRQVSKEALRVPHRESVFRFNNFNIFRLRPTLLTTYRPSPFTLLDQRWSSIQHAELELDT